MKHIDRRRMMVATAAGIASISGPALAAWPEKPITILVPYAPGGAADLVARTIGERMAETLRQPVLIVNRAGAAGAIASREVARSPADGYMMVLGTSASHGTNMSTFKNLSYDAVKDFAPVSLVSTGPYVLVVPASSPVTSVKELIAHATANPGKMNYGTPGRGGQTHLVSEMFAIQTKIQLQGVHYRGEGPAVIDVVGGQLQLMFATVAAVLPMVQAGKIRVLACCNRERLPSMPDVPTLIEAGVQNFEAVSWIALYAPAKTPPATVRLLNEAVNKGLQSPTLISTFQKVGIQPGGGTPEDLGRRTAADVAMYAAVTEAMKFVPE